MTKKNIRFKFLVLFALAAVLGLLVFFLLSGGNLQLLRSLFLEEHTTEELREQLSDFKLRGFVTVSVLSALQILFTFLPAEPAQVLAGVAFGFPVGLLCCMIGVFVGNSLIFLLCKLSGNRLREYFLENLHFDFQKAAHSKKTTLLIFLLYFLPAIPYGVICFFAASVKKGYARYIAVTMLGSLPSVCIGVGLGHVATASSWILTVLVFLLIVALLIVFKFKKEVIFEKLNAFVNKLPYDSATAVRDCNPFLLNFAYFVSVIIFFFKGVRIQLKNKLDGEIEGPAIVLCNHGSFIDFAYAGRLLRKKHPNFIVARLYFYKKWLGNLLRRLGCFPKSMFAADIESARNCLRVLKKGGVLAMMPEARLSTVGKFEDIQESTYDFLKAAKAPIYSITIHGDYFAKPKWGKGLRRGAVVEAELDILLTAAELKETSVEELKRRVEGRLYYDEFEWIQTRPAVHYRSKRLAEGLENILTRCPKCQQKYTLTTKGRDILCETCGRLATLDDRYGFAADAPFKDFAHWYDWQKEEMRREIEGDPDYALTSKVDFCLPSQDGKTTLRPAGKGICTLNRDGLFYAGKKDAEKIDLHFDLEHIYRVLFGAGENFEVYVGHDIHYFIPKEKRSAVDWYIASSILADLSKKEPPSTENV